MKIVGIAGAKRAGKDTLATEILKLASCTLVKGVYGGELGGIHRVFTVAFADALKRMVVPLGYPIDVLWGPSEKRTWVHPVLGISARDMLQRLGTEVARQIDPDFWVKAWCDVVDKIDAGNYTYAPASGLQEMAVPTSVGVFIVVPDLRFANEHAELARRGAYTVLVERDTPGQSGQDVDQHVSERWCREAARQFVHEVVVNDGPVEALEPRARAIFEAVVG